MIALIVGTVLALAALAFVLLPIFREASVPAPVMPGRVPTPEPGSSERALAVAALREIEFDRATGKLSDADYAELKGTYTELALAAMRREERGAPAVADDEIEALVASYRAKAPACSSCGPRPEPDAIYCSGCGRYLPGACGQCGADVAEPGARFCAGCGHALAA